MLSWRCGFVLLQAVVENRFVLSIYTSFDTIICCHLQSFVYYVSLHLRSLAGLALKMAEEGGEDGRIPVISKITGGPFEDLTDPQHSRHHREKLQSIVFGSRVSRRIRC
jgi:hypothetical protein